MIYQLREEWAIDPILDMIRKRKDIFKISIEKVRKYIVTGIKDNLSIVLIDEKDKKLNGFVFASIEDFDGEDVCFIHSCIISRDRKYTCHDFIARLREWSKEKKVKTLFMTTNKHEDGFDRKYGFKYHSTLMSLPVNK